MALGASLRESRTHVVRVGRPLEVLQVATDASGICAGQVVVAIDVALRTLHARVSAGQGESCRGVIKGCVVPRSGGVALLAACREPRLYVVRIRCAVEILHVA